jgi:hypothetical protein
VPRLEVWEDRIFHVSSTADHIIDSIIQQPQRASETQSDYVVPGHRSLQVDLLVYDKERKSLRAYEVKRGCGVHDSGKRRSILRDILCTQVLLRSYGVSRGLDIAQAESRIVFYYGSCSIPKPYSLIADELDDHFEWPIREAVEKVNSYFRSRLFEILSASPTPA